MMIRRAFVKDLKSLVKIDEESDYPRNQEKKIEDPNFTKEELTKRFSNGLEVFFICCKGREPIGYATFQRNSKTICEVRWLVVRKKYHNQGMGKALTKHIEKFAKMKGFRKIMLYTWIKNTGARKFYERLGYTHVKTIKNFYHFKKDNTTVVYEKKL